MRIVEVDGFRQVSFTVHHVIMQLHAVYYISAFPTIIPIDRLPVKSVQLLNVHPVPTIIEYKNKRINRGYSIINPAMHIINVNRCKQNEPKLYHR